MGSASELNIEKVLNDSVTDRGIRQTRPLLVQDWTLGTGAALSTSGNLKLAAVETEWNLMQWAAAGAATDTAELQFRLPSNFVKVGNNLPGELKLRLAYQKVDASADENADLKIEGQVIWRSATATANKTLATPVSISLIPSVTAADWDTMTEIELDIGEQIAAESKTMEAGDYILVKLRPHETVGSSDMVLNVRAHELVYRQHAAAVDVTDRGSSV